VLSQAVSNNPESINMKFITNLPKEKTGKINSSQSTPASYRDMHYPPRRTMMALEPRIMFDGAAAETAADAVVDAKPPVQDAPAIDAVKLAQAVIDAPPVVEPPVVEPPRHDIYFIDPNIGDIQSIIAALPATADYHVLDGGSDGVAQITAILKDKQNIDAIQIVSEGGTGHIALGTDVLWNETLNYYAPSIAGWGHALKPGGDILIYGCDLAASAEGKMLVDNIARLTGADVAASTDLTGAANLGGDWQLEYQTGGITASALNAVGFQDTLATLVVTSLADDNGAGLTLREAVVSANGNGVADTIVFDPSLFADGAMHTITLLTGELDISGNNNTDAITILGPGADRLTVSGNNASRIFSAYNSTGATATANTSAATLSGMTLTNGLAANNGGAIRSFYSGNLTLDHMIVKNSNTTYGGAGVGFYSSASGSLSISNSMIYGNTGSQGPGGIFANTSTGSITIENSAIFNNSNNNPAAGGDIYGGGANLKAGYGTTTISNVTFYNNTAQGGSGLAIAHTGIVRNSTFMNNHANSASTSATGALWQSTAAPFNGSVTLYNNIFSGNTATGGGSDVADLFIHNGSITGKNNIYGDKGIFGSGSISLTGTVAGAPNLGTFGANGGFVKTVPILTGSSAIAAGLTTGAPTTDARGYGRGVSIDIGAYEYSDNTTFNFVGTLFPSNSSIDVPSSNNLVIDFGQAVTAVAAKNIVIYKTSDNSVFESIPVTDARVTIGAGLNGNSKVTINPTATFASLTGYYVLIDSGAFTDASAKTFNGIASNLTWAFTSVAAANAAPTLGGTFTTTGTVNDNATTTPFGSVTVADAESNNVSITITYTAANGTLTGTGLTGSAGSYTLTSAALATVQSNLQGLVFHPTANQVAPASTVVTTFTLTPNDGTLNGSANATTVVTATSINDAPVITSNSGGANASISVAENQTTVTTVTATDVDTSSTITYSKSGADAGLFTINSSTGVLTFTSAPNFEAAADAGGNNIYDVTVTATDNGTGLLTDTQAIAVTVTDVNEAPTLGGTFTTTGTVNDNATTTPFSGVTVADVEGNNVSLTITYTGANGALTGTGLTNNGSGDYTLTSTDTATLITRLQALVFTPTANQVAVGSTVVTTFTLTPNDGALNGSANATTVVTATSINDAPGLDNTQTPTFTSINEDVLSGSNSGTTVSTMVVNSSITDPDGAIEAVGVSAVDNSNGSWEYKVGAGSWTAFDFTGGNSGKALLLDSTDSIRFVPNANWNGTVSSGVTFYAWDKSSSSAGSYLTVTGNTGGSGSLSTASDTASIVVNVVNDIPVIANLSGDSASFVVGGTAVNIDTATALTVTDIDSANFNGGYLTITNATGTNNGNFSVDGTTVTSGGDGVIAGNENIVVSGTTIGTVHATSTGQGANALRIDFTADATPALVATLLQNIKYVAPSTVGARTFNVVLSDNGTDVSATAGITLTGTPNPPVFSNLSGDNVTYTEAGAAVLLDQNTAVSITDADSTDFNGGTLTVAITANKVSAEDVLSIRTGSGVTLSSGTTVGSSITDTASGNVIGTIAASGTGTGADNLVVTLNANATPATVATLLQNITYVNSNTGNPSALSRTMTITLTDAASNFGTGTATVTVGVTAVNDAPTISAAPASIAVTEDVATALTGISVADVDAGSSSVVATFTVGSGALTGDGTIATANSVTVGGTTTALTLTGTTTNINAFIAASGLKFTTVSNATASVTLGVSVNDQGNTGTGGALGSSVSNVTLNVTAVNDAPTVSAAPASITVTEDVATVLTGISVADVDAAAGNVVATFTVGSGTLAGVGATATANSVTVGGTATALTLTGTVSNINAFIAASGLTFTTAANATSVVTLGVSVNDGGNTGAGGAQGSGTSNVTLNVTAVNDAPTITNAATHTFTGVDENTAAVGVTVNTILTGTASWADPDGVGVAKGIAVTATVGNGVWQYSTDGTTWTGFGTVSAGSALLLDGATQVRYVPDSANGETATFSYKAWDETSGTASSNGTRQNANPGAGGGATAFSTSSANGSITVSGVNDAPTGVGNLTLAAVTQDTTNPTGTAISALTGYDFQDVDASSTSPGVLVVGNTANAVTEGVWQYSSDGGTNWKPVGTVAEGATALALSSATQVRFVPVANYSGTPPALSVRALDNTYVAAFSTTTGGAETRVIADSSANGGTTAISGNLNTISTSVTAKSTTSETPVQEEETPGSNLTQQNGNTDNKPNSDTGMGNNTNTGNNTGTGNNTNADRNNNPSDTHGSDNSNTNNSGNNSSDNNNSNSGSSFSQTVVVDMKLSVDSHGNGTSGGTINIPSSAFAELNTTGAITITATQSSGQSLPSFISVNPSTGAVTVKEGAVVTSPITVKVTIRDAQGKQVVVLVKVQPQKGKPHQQNQEQEEDQQTDDGERNQGDNSQGQGRGQNQRTHAEQIDKQLAHAGKPGLTQQLQMVGSKGFELQRQKLLDSLASLVSENKDAA